MNRSPVVRLIEMLAPNYPHQRVLTEDVLLLERAFMHKDTDALYQQQFRLNPLVAAVARTLYEEVQQEERVLEQIEKQDEKIIEYVKPKWLETEASNV